MRTIARNTVRLLRLPLIAAVAALIAYLAWMGLVGSLAVFEHPDLPSLEDRELGDRVLVVAPHPDDETLAAGGLVRRCTASGKQVMVVVVTCGDGFRRIVGAYRTPTGTVSPYIRLGEARAEESRKAADVLGLPSAGLVFLGYPDGAMAALWDGAWDRPSVGVNGASAVPYDFAYRPGAKYEASSVAGDLSSIVASFAPTAVVYPDPEDSNTDHWAVNAFTELTLDRTRTTARRLTYLVHRGHFPFPWSYVPGDWIVPPRALAGVGTEWLSAAVSREDERLKESALMVYKSQQRAIEPFLSSFVRRNELFGVARSAIVTRAASPVSLDASAMPGVVVRDPASDTILRLVDGGADLRRVAIVRDGGTVWLGVETRSAPPRTVTYRVSLRLLAQQAVPSRVDIDVQGTRASAVPAGPGSLVPSGLEARVRGNRIWVGVPASLFAGVTDGMVCVESSQGSTVIDRTASRSFVLR